MKNKFIIIIISILMVSYFIIVFSCQLKYPQMKWDWNKIDTENIYFPKDFLWGVSTAAHQVEGNNTNNQWYVWENSVDENGKPRVEGGQKSGIACDHWNRYPEDIRLMKELGVKAYRFSVEWSRIEPQKAFLTQLPSGITRMFVIR